MRKRGWLALVLLLGLAAVVPRFLQPDEDGGKIRETDSQVDELPDIEHSIVLDETEVSIVLPHSLSSSPESSEPHITHFKPLDVWTKYSQLAEEGDLNAIYILAFVINKCRNVDSEDFVGRIGRSNLPPDLKASEIRRFERCSPLVPLIGDLGLEHDRLYQTLHDEWHPLTIVNVPGNPPVATRDRLVHALMGNYPEQFMYERAFLAALVFVRDDSDNPDVHQQEAWTILYCEASLECDSKEYLADLRASKFHDHDIDEILEMVAEIKDAISSGNPDELGL